MRFPGWPLSPGLPLLPRELLIEFGHIVIPFRLVTRAGHWGPKLVLFAERCHFEFATVVSRSVAEDGLVTLQWPLLLVNQPDIAVKAWRERGRKEDITQLGHGNGDVPHVHGSANLGGPQEGP